MAHKTKINGTAYEITGSRTRVNGVGRDIVKGRTRVNGIGYDIPFGGDVISFYLNNWDDPTVMPTYKAESGMTWIDFCESSYNVDWVFYYDYGEYIVTWSNGSLAYLLRIYDDLTFTYRNVGPEEEIIDGQIYEAVPW